MAKSFRIPLILDELLLSCALLCLDSRYLSERRRGRGKELSAFLTMIKRDFVGIFRVKFKRHATCTRIHLVCRYIPYIGKFVFPDFEESVSGNSTPLKYTSIESMFLETRLLLNIYLLNQDSNNYIWFLSRAFFFPKCIMFIRDDLTLLNFNFLSLVYLLLHRDKLKGVGRPREIQKSRKFILTTDSKATYSVERGKIANAHWLGRKKLHAFQHFSANTNNATHTMHDKFTFKLLLVPKIAYFRSEILFWQ